MASLSSMGEKFRLIREAEGMTRQEFADCVGLPYGTVTNYEVRGKQVTEGALLKVTKHPKFKKYAYWLSTDETMPEVGKFLRLSLLMASPVWRAIRVQPKQNKNYPAEARKLVRPAFCLV